MRTLALVAVLLAAVPAVAKPWQGIEPGVSKRDDVMKKFGEPSARVTSDGKEIHRLLRQGGDQGHHPGPVQGGPATQAGRAHRRLPRPGHRQGDHREHLRPGLPTAAGARQPRRATIKKITDDFRTYYLYPKLGLAMFFNEDGKTVQSFIFTTPEGRPK